MTIYVVEYKFRDLGGDWHPCWKGDGAALASYEYEVQANTERDDRIARWGETTDYRVAPYERKEPA